MSLESAQLTLYVMGAIFNLVGNIKIQKTYLIIICVDNKLFVLR